MIYRHYNHVFDAAAIRLANVMAIRVQRTAIKAGRYEQTVIGTSSLLMLLSRSAVCGVCAVCRQQLGFFVLVLLQFDASLNRNLCCEALLSTG